MCIRDRAEIVIAISADDIERSKRRGDLGITYDDDTLRLDVYKRQPVKLPSSATAANTRSCSSSINN